MIARADTKMDKKGSGTFLSKNRADASPGIALEPHTPVLTPAVPAIQCADVWKQYYFYAHRPRKLKDALANLISLKKAPPREPVWAVRKLDLQVYPGEIVGVVGHNGSGKSTLLKLLSRILKPTKGTVKIRGRLNAIIELGAGFHEDLTARDNVYLAASFMNLAKKEIDDLYPAIVDFAGLAEHMDTPVKYFSSGMHARLGFSIAVNTNPDVLLIDEVLAVGDANFQPKCLKKIEQFREAGKAILFVSHDLHTIRNLCDRAIWLKSGQLMHEGPPIETVDTYLEHYWPGCTKTMKWTDR